MSCRASGSFRIAVSTAFRSPRTPHAVVVEHRGDALDVARASGLLVTRFADQPRGHERPDVRMVEDAVEHAVGVLQHGLVRPAACSR